MEKDSLKLDEALGLNSSIIRQEYLNGAPLSAEEAWNPFFSPIEILNSGKARRTSAPYSGGGGGADDLFSVGHEVRDGAYDDASVRLEETGEVFDLAVIGGGFSGLAAAYFLNRAKEGQTKTLILEGNQAAGGNARRDEFIVGGRTLYAPQGSIVAQELPPALAPPAEAGSIFDEIGIDFEALKVPPEASAFSVFWDQKSHRSDPQWYGNVFQAPLPEDVKRDFMSFIEGVMGFYANPDWKQNLRQLDSFTFKDYVEREKKWTPSLYRTMLPDLASFFGFPDAVSAAAVYAQYGGGPRPLYSFPGGNSGFFRHLLKRLIPAAIPGGLSSEEILGGRINPGALDQVENPVRVRLGATAVRVEHEGAPDEAKRVRIVYSKGGKLYCSYARTAVMAGGGYITQHIVRGLPPEKREAYSRFRYTPVLWINVALNNSRAIDKAGLNLLSTYHDGFGVMLALYEKIRASDQILDPERPNVIGIGAPLFYPGLQPQAQAVKGRVEMLETSFLDYERRIREELARLLGPWGFDPKRDIEAISISRWGHHGYVFPYPGFFAGSTAEIAKKPFGRIGFAHTDLDRFSHMMGAIGQAYRAVQDILPFLKQ
jgi:spermidine dehydrogenase